MSETLNPTNFMIEPRKEAFKEIILDIPRAVIIDVNDNYEVTDIHGRDKSLIEKIFNIEEDKHNEQ